MTAVNDIVLIYIEDAPMSFARVEDILPDVKKDWYQIKLLMLQIPLHVVTWILKDEYINGREFSMNGKRMRLEKVESPEKDLQLPKKDNPSLSKTDNKTEPKKPNKAKIISFSDLKKT